MRIAGRIADQSGGPAPDNLYVLERPAPLWTTDKGESGRTLERAMESYRPDRAHLVVIDPASAALEGTTNDSAPVGGYAARGPHRGAPWIVSRWHTSGTPLTLMRSDYESSDVA